jgi:hypothetical protein
MRNFLWRIRSATVIARLSMVFYMVLLEAGGTSNESGISLVEKA